MNKARRTVLLLLLAGMAAGVIAQNGFPQAELGINNQRISVEVALTTSARATGLMYRRTLPVQQGMIFVFDDSGMYCMWMNNTFIPLSVAFLDESGQILNIEDMKANTRDLHCPSEPARYALEMNLGWYRNNGVSAGDTVSGLDRLPKAHQP